MAKKLSKAVGKGKKMVSIPLYYRITDGPYDNMQFQILAREEGKKAVEKGDSSVEVLNTKWRANSWQLTNVLMQSSLSYNPQTGQHEVDLTKYQDNMLKSCLVEWDLTDEGDQAIPVTPEALDDLPPEIAKGLIRVYDRSNLVDEGEIKK